MPAGDVSGSHNDDKDIDPGPPNPYNSTMLKHMLQVNKHEPRPQPRPQPQPQPQPRPRPRPQPQPQP